MSKVLITSGCSFTESKYIINEESKATKTWAYQLGRYLNVNYNYQFINKALGSQGNGLISRSILYQVTEELKTKNPEDILVGVMWSGVDRFDYRYEYPELAEFSINGTHNGWMENPTGFIDKLHKKWIILNQHWTNGKQDKFNKEADLYYKHFHDIIGSYIYSLEHMLRLQYFLKYNNIKYFFTIYQDHVFDPKYTSHNEVNYLFNLLDKEHFLPISSEYSWCIERGIDVEHWVNPHPHNHPSSIHHKYFMNEVIVPWLKTKNYI